MNTPPKLSIVATARNDNHGGHLLRRMQIFINGILALSHKYQLPVELILVEWNPPPDQPKLAQALAWPKQHDFCTIRIIEVPPAIHQRYKYAAKLPLYQMIAKNVGIRRAQGPFILATNIDILFSEELFAFLATSELEKGKIYRVNRYDVHQEVPLEAPIEEQLAYCQQHLIRINDRYGTSNLLTGEFHRTGYYPAVSLTDYLHTNTCGDFQLMAREDWEKVHSYAELDMYSFYLDSALAYLAYFLGITQVVLPDTMRTYHIEHDSGFKDEESQKLWDKLSSVQIPRIENFEALIVKIAQAHRPDMFNDDQWGLVSESLPEQYLVQATPPWAAMPTTQGTAQTMQKTAKTVLSIVVTSRHDDHGGNLLHRMQAFINGLVYQCQKFNLAAELIIVEWNPLPDKEKLASVIQWPQPLAPLTVRIIEVPPELHRQIGNSDKIPLFQMIAKNVGIRRARGEFVLLTNIDILFSDELIWFLAQGLLDANCFYRIDRYDVGRQTIPLDLPFELQLAFCQKNLVRVQGLNGTVPVTNSEQYMVSPTTTEGFLKQSPLNIASLLKMGEGQKLHDNACGDFTLMAREKWFALRAYPEMPLWSIHVDTVFLNMASVIGLQQVILPNPMRIYHIEHEMGWAVIQDTVKERPSLDWYRDILPWCQKMLQEKAVMTPNNEEWGFAQTVLEECVVVSR